MNHHDIARYLPVVERVAKKVCRDKPRLDFDDAFSDGQMGLLEAVEKHRQRPVYNFDSYAARCIELKIRHGFSGRDGAKAARQGGSLLSLDAPAGDDEDAAPLSALVAGRDAEKNPARSETLQHDAILALAEDLSGDAMRIVLMRYEQCLTFREIAAALGRPVESVRRAHHAAVDVVRARLGKDFFGNPLIEDPMKNEKPTPAQTAVEKAQEGIAHLGNKQLKEMLKESLALTAQHVIRASAILRELKKRGEDLSEFNRGLLHFIGKVADGKLLPEALIKLAPNPPLIQRMAGLPAAVQRQILTNEPLAVVVPAGKRGIDTIMKEPLLFKRDEVNLVIGKGKIRTPQEQAAILATPPRPPQQMRSPVTVDKAKQGIIVGGYFIGIADLHKFIQEIEGAAAAA